MADLDAIFGRPVVPAGQQGAPGVTPGVPIPRSATQAAPLAQIRAQLPIGRGRNNAERISDLEQRLSNLETQPTVPAALSQQVSLNQADIATRAQEIRNLNTRVTAINSGLQQVNVNLAAETQNRMVADQQVLKQATDAAAITAGQKDATLRADLTQNVIPNAVQNATVGLRQQIVNVEVPAAIAPVSGVANSALATASAAQGRTTSFTTQFRKAGGVSDQFGILGTDVASMTAFMGQNEPFLASELQSARSEFGQAGGNFTTWRQSGFTNVSQLSTGIRNVQDGLIHVGNSIANITQQLLAIKTALLSVQDRGNNLKSQFRQA